MLWVGLLRLQGGLVPDWLGRVVQQAASVLLSEIPTRFWLRIFSSLGALAQLLPLVHQPQSGRVLPVLVVRHYSLLAAHWVLGRIAQDRRRRGFFAQNLCGMHHRHFCLHVVPHVSCVEPCVRRYLFCLKVWHHISICRNDDTSVVIPKRIL